MNIEEQHFVFQVAESSKRVTMRGRKDVYECNTIAI